MDTDYFSSGLRAYASRVRDGEFTFETAISASLNRIEVLDKRLNAFQCVDWEGAIESAKNLDQQLASGTDLGPLMGVAVAVKDIISVNGLPTTNGSKFSPDHLKYDEGALIHKLRSAGCIVLGKTKTVEFALGATGINEVRGTPWNPWDAKQHRIPGGSSSGSAVAVAAGLCGFALGTDTGGSVRIPACYNGITGHKTTLGLWPTDGVFPLCPSFDSVGPLCRTVDDALIIHGCVAGQFADEELSLKGLRFGVPQSYFLDDLDKEVQLAFTQAIDQLTTAGVEFVDVDIPGAVERETLMPVIIGAEIIQALTPEGFKLAYDDMDPVTRTRASIGLDVKTEDYTRAKDRVAELQNIVANRCTDLDALVSPTCLILPPALADMQQSSTVSQRALLSSRNTQPGNMFGMCATTLPTSASGATQALPIGFQIMMPGGQDSRLLMVSNVVQRCLGIPDTPDLAGFAVD